MIKTISANLVSISEGVETRVDLIRSFGYGWIPHIVKVMSAKERHLSVTYSDCENGLLFFHLLANLPKFVHVLPKV